MTRIKIEGTRELIQRITTIQGMRRVKASVKQSAVLIQGYAKVYPAESHRANPYLSGGGEKSAAMRRGFFYHLNHGDIQVPYKRGGGSSQKLNQSWTLVTGNSGWRATVGTSVSYAGLVMGSKQTSYHKKTGWKTTTQIKKEHEGEVVNMVMTALKKEVEGG